MTAHRPQEGLGALEPRRFLGRQHAKIDELCDILDAVNVFGDPVEGVQIPEPALTFLDVGLELIAAIADPLMPGIALGKLGLDKLRRGAAHNVGVEALLQFGVKRLLPPDVARLEERRADRQIALGIAQAIGDRARRLSDFEAEIP